MKIDVEKLLEEKAHFINKTIEKYIPRKYNKKSLVFTLGPPRYEYNEETLNKAISEPMWEFLDRGGKRWRPSLFLLICEALGKAPEELVDFAIIPEIVHNGLLMIDDIEDSSELRRGKPCTYRLFGLDIAINVANEMFYLPLLPLIKSRNKIPGDKIIKIYEIYVQEMINVGFGQAMDIAWHRGLADADKVTWEQYAQMCVYKTGTIARMAAKMAAVLSDADDGLVETLGRFAESIGVAFQIQDDVLDLVGEKFAKGKGGVGRDVTEGKRSLIVINTLEKATYRDEKRLLEILSMHTSDQRLIAEAIAIASKYGSIRYAKEFARNLVANSWKEIDSLLLPSDAKEKLRTFANYLIERKI